MHNFSKIVIKFWIRVKRTDRSQKCPANTNDAIDSIQILKCSNFSLNNFTFKKELVWWVKWTLCTISFFAATATVPNLGPAHNHSCYWATGTPVWALLVVCESMDCNLPLNCHSSMSWLDHGCLTSVNLGTSFLLKYRNFLKQRN